MVGLVSASALTAVATPAGQAASDHPGPAHPSTVGASDLGGTPRTGYWAIQADGMVFNFGDAAGFGPDEPLPLNAPLVAAARTPDGRGYWLVASDGGVFTFGDAGFYGSTGAIHLNQPIVAAASTPDGRGYWLAASDGGVFTFGDAEFDGSTADFPYPEPTIAFLPQAPSTGTVAANSPFPGTWGAHGAVLRVAPDGRMALDFRIYEWCTDGPPPCDYTVGPILTYGGHIGGVITSVNGNTANVDIFSSIGGDPPGPSTMTFDPVNDAIRWNGGAFCGPSSPSNFCGA
jgi:hypothetical protein